MHTHSRLGELSERRRYRASFSPVTKEHLFIWIDIVAHCMHLKQVEHLPEELLIPQECAVNSPNTGIADLDPVGVTAIFPRFPAFQCKHDPST